MPTKTIKKVTTRRPRRTVATKVPIKRSHDEDVINVINLKQPFINEVASNKPSFDIGPAEEPTTKNWHWSFKLYRKLALSFILVAVLILGVVAYFALVKLEIIVTPRVMPVQAKSTFTIYDRPGSFNLPPSSILGIVREMELDYTETYKTTGGEVTGAEISGRVTIVNNYIKDQPLVATTRLLTKDNQLLRLRDTVLVPAGGAVEVEVYGESTDPSFTLADARLTIPGLWAGLQDKIYAEAKANSVTYKETRKNIVTQADLDRALASAKQALVEKAATEIASVYSSYDERIYELDDSATAFSFDAKVGDEKDKLAINISSKIKVVAFKKDLLVNLNETTLESSLGQGQVLLEESVSKPSFKVVSSDTVDNIAEVELLADGSSIMESEDKIIDRHKLIGLNSEQIENYLSSLDNIESYELHFTPSFLKIAPQVVDKITVKIK